MKNRCCNWMVLSLLAQLVILLSSGYSQSQ